MTPAAYVAQHALPAALALLLDDMDSPAARAMVLAICWQESGFRARRQYGNGPARGWAQFEMGGVEGVLEHPASRDHAAKLCRTLGYDSADARAVHLAIEHNDVLALGFARLLLWTDPRALPQSSGEAPMGWLQYYACWRPGKPHESKWAESFARGWAAVACDLPGTVRA